MSVLLVLLLTAGALSPAAGPQIGLLSYGDLAAEYQAGDRETALRRIRRWRRDEISEALRALRKEGDRREKLVRIKKKNQDAADRALAGGKLDALFGSQVLEIGEDRVTLRLADGAELALDNDYVFIFAGGVPPFELLRRVGARFGGETPTS